MDGRCRTRPPRTRGASRDRVIVLRRSRINDTEERSLRPDDVLPERIGGGAAGNWTTLLWCAMRTFTLNVVDGRRSTDEALAWRNGCGGAVAGDPQRLQLCTASPGERSHSRIVVDGARVGGVASRGASVPRGAMSRSSRNYGEMMDALHEGRPRGLARDDHAGRGRKGMEFSKAAWNQPETASGRYVARDPALHAIRGSGRGSVRRESKRVERWDRPGRSSAAEHPRRDPREVVSEGFNVRR